MLGRFDKFYLDRETQMIEREERYCTKIVVNNRIYNEGVQNNLKLSKPRI